MRTPFLALVVGLVAAGCESSRPTYQLIIGRKSIDLPVRDDPGEIQNDIVSHVKPLWDELRTGNSVPFQFQRTFPSKLGEDLAEKARADGRTVIATCTIKSARLRFFKDRNGTAGCEECKEGAEGASPMCVMNVADWQMIEATLRENEPTFSVK